MKVLKAFSLLVFCLSFASGTLVCLTNRADEITNCFKCSSEEDYTAGCTVENPRFDLFRFFQGGELISDFIW